ncbi:MAG: flagellar basal body-associated FliL family protein [Gammaproteobacteria bacterium]|nr:flagellar basal body-associated FliL family protein [Gammaproteobacteria bacterium]
MAEEQEPTEEAAGGGGGKKLILIIIGALLLVGISVGATIFILGGNQAEEEVVEVEAEPEKGDPEYIELKSFTVNLDPQDPVGFLQVTIHVLAYNSDVADDLEQHNPLIRNNLTLLFGQQKSADLRSAEGKTSLQQKVHESIQQVIEKYGSGSEVDSIYFSDFVMQ